MSDAYSPIKAFRHPDIVEGVKAGRPVRPAHVQMVVANACNLSCSFCAYRSPGYSSAETFNDRDMMPVEKAVEILDDCEAMGVSAVQFTGGGEPTVHPQIRDILEAAAARGLDYSLVTNGVNVHRKGLADVAARAAWVRVSMDAASPSLYGKVKTTRPERFADACSAVADISKERDRQQTDVVIGVGFVVTPDNFHEVERAAHLARELGADNIRISAQFSTDGPYLFAGCYRRAAEACENAESAADGGFRVYNRFPDRIKDLRDGRPGYTRCGYQYMTTYIGADLGLYRCCVTSFSARGLVGSLKERRFRDLWLSQERADSMDTFDARGCELCQFGTINRTIGYAIDPEPQLHEGFV